MSIIDVRNDASNPMADLASVREWALAYIEAHPEPDFHVGPADDQQLQRWYVLPRNPFANVYLHRFLRSDDDRALHDHPADNKSWILSGEYLEHLQDSSCVTRFEGDIVERRAIEAHRVELVTGPAVTLFFTGPRIRDWGFYCPRGWVRWQDFTAGPRGELVGRGCE